MSISSNVTRTSLPRPVLRRIAPRRLSQASPATLQLAGPGRRWSVEPERLTFVARAARALHALYGRMRDQDALLPADEAAPQSDLVEARLMSDHWRRRAEAAEARVEQLEALLAGAETAALDLRSRIICLQGKLAIASATARYQTMALALEHDRTPIDTLMDPV